MTTLTDCQECNHAVPLELPAEADCGVRELARHASGGAVLKGYQETSGRD